MKLEDIKTFWPILCAVVVLSGFYYTTQLRLDQLENDVATLQHRTEAVELREKKIEQDIKKLRKRNTGRKHQK